MQRNENESFSDYKARRAIANEAVKNINIATKNAGKTNTRANRVNKGVVAYSYGNLLRAAFAKKALEKIRTKA
jgi:hypothetical protein